MTDPRDPAPAPLAAWTDAALPILVGLLLFGILPGCSISPARQEAIRQAWEERDAERARECYRVGRAFAGGGCSAGGGP